jgi:hypothetical protein
VVWCVVWCGVVCVRDLPLVAPLSAFACRLVFEPVLELERDFHVRYLTCGSL